MSDLLKLVDGYKTYLGAGGFALLGLFYLSQGLTDKAGEMFLAALGLVGLRSAVEKAKPVE